MDEVLFALIVVVGAIVVVVVVVVVVFRGVFVVILLLCSGGTVFVFVPVVVRDGLVNLGIRVVLLSSFWL